MGLCPVYNGVGWQDVRKQARSAQSSLYLSTHIQQVLNAGISESPDYSPKSFQ